MTTGDFPSTDNNLEYPKINRVEGEPSDQFSKQAVTVLLVVAIAALLGWFVLMAWWICDVAGEMVS